MKPAENQVHHILQRHLPFYRGLSDRNKKIFRNRTFFFMRNIIFRGGDDFKITMEHTMAVSGAFIQISFGLDNFLLNEFEIITIYPEIYKSTVTGMYHKGDVNPRGAIAVSWKDFVQGYETDKDNLNVGLHEMAHAWFFSISHIRFDANENTYDLLSKFVFLSEEEVVKIRHNKKSIFRKYASENVYEFFAVSIEYFFEDAKEFKQELPNLYRHLCLLLNQDPAEGIPKGIKVENYFNKDNLTGYLPKSTQLQIPAEKSGVATHKRTKPFVATFFGLQVLLFIYAIIAELDSDIYFLYVNLILFSVFFYWLFARTNKEVDIVDHYMIFHRRKKTNRQIFAIHLENILTVNLDTVKNIFLVTYLHHGKIKKVELGSKNEYSFLRFSKLLGSNNVVLKKQGTRIPRIKSKNRWRK